MIHHIWFDFAGTLYKETPEFNKVHDVFRYQTYADLKGIENLAIAKDEFLKLYEKEGSNSAVFRALGQSSDYWMKALDKLDFTAILHPDSEIFETLAVLKDRIPISLFTNFVKYRINSVLEHLQIPPEYFTHILSGDEITERKPALDGFYAMIEKSGVPADQILYVGDRVDVDVKPAKQLGIKTCLLYGESHEADYCAKTFRDILKIPIGQ